MSATVTEPAPLVDDHAPHPGNDAAEPEAAVADPANQMQLQSASYDPVRTDPVKLLEPRKRRLERQPEEKTPEIHIIGSIAHASNVLQDLSEGFCLRWKFEHGKVWHLLEGEVSGQTHVVYGKHNLRDTLVLSHPFSLHFAAVGMQGWGAPRLVCQTFRLDDFGRRIAAGYGFVHIPFTPGSYTLEVPLWRPVGSPDQELKSYLLGETPALSNPDPIYDSAWKDRCRMMTTSAGSVFVEVNVLTRYMAEQGIA